MSILVTVLLTLHLLAAIIWVGGMFFIWMVLRPVLDTMDEEPCLTLWATVLSRFFHWVWGSIIVLLITGFSLISLRGGFSTVSLAEYIMIGTGVLMIALFKFVYIVPFDHLRRGVEQTKWQVARYALRTIHLLSATISVIGLISVAAILWMPG